MTLRGKIAIAMAVLTAFTAIIVAVSTYAVTDNRVRSEVDQYLDGYAQRFQDPDGRQAAVTCASTNIRRLPQGVQRDPEAIQGVAFQCLDKSGSVMNTIGVGTLPVSEEDLAIAASGRNEITRTVNVNRKTWRVETVGVAQGGAIQIARDYGETNRVLSALRVWLSLIVVGAAAISALSCDEAAGATHRRS